MVAVGFAFTVFVVVCPRLTTPEYVDAAATILAEALRFTVMLLAVFEAPGWVDHISTRDCVVQQLTAAWSV
jgi:hypothetical protein